MNFTHEELHELSGASARLAAIVSLLSDPVERKTLDPARTDQDVRAALEKFAALWKSARSREKGEA